MVRSLLIIPAIHLITFLAIALDLPVFRQVVVFVYLTFVPGFVLLKFLKLKETKTVDVFLLSVGLSIAFLMFVGFLMSGLYLIVGISMPLSVTPVVITLGVLTLFLFLLGYRRELYNRSSLFVGNIMGLRDIVPKSVILVLPVLFGIIGAVYVAFPSFSILFLSLMIIIVAILFAVSGFSRRYIPHKFYPLMIFAISIALALHILLISKYIVGYDAQLEYQIFKLTANRGYWSVLPIGLGQGSALNFNAMLSVTVLPSIYSAMLNIEGEVLFKTLYPFVFSLVPVVLYRVYTQSMGRVSSLLSALFLISTPLVFYGVGLLSVNRQIVAMFFLVLSVLVLLDKKMTVGSRRILFLVFGAALIVSHYSTAHLFLGLIFLTYAILRIRRMSNRVLNGSMVLLLFIVSFVWYSFNESPLNTLRDFFQLVASRFFQDLTSTVARDPTVFATHSVLTVASAINWVLFLLVHFMLLVGILGVILQSQKAKLDPTFRVLLIISSGVLFLSLAVPNIAPALDFSRFYQLSLLFLAPCFVLGGQTLLDVFARLLRQVTRRGFLVNTQRIGTILVCVVLIGYFLSQSGFINNVTRAAPQSYSLDFSRIIASKDPAPKASLYTAYISEQNFYSAVWLTNHAGQASIVYADSDSRQNVLFSYGSIHTIYLPLSNSSVPVENSYIYLSSLNVGDGVIAYRDWPITKLFNFSEISPILEGNNLIYNNGNGEIWQTSG